MHVILNMYFIQYFSPFDHVGLQKTCFKCFLIQKSMFLQLWLGPRVVLSPNVLAENLHTERHLETTPTHTYIGLPVLITCINLPGLVSLYRISRPPTTWPISNRRPTSRGIATPVYASAWLRGTSTWYQSTGSVPATRYRVPGTMNVVPAYDDVIDPVGGSDNAFVLTNPDSSAEDLRRFTDITRQHCRSSCPSVCLSVCLSVCSVPLAQQRWILGLWLLKNTNRNPHATSYFATDSD